MNALLSYLNKYATLGNALLVTVGGLDHFAELDDLTGVDGLGGVGGDVGVCPFCNAFDDNVAILG